MSTAPDSKCQICQQSGHMALQCPSYPTAPPVGRGCTNDNRGNGPHRDGRQQFIPRQPHPGNRPQAGRGCYECGGFGHFARDCANVTSGCVMTMNQPPPMAWGNPRGNAGVASVPSVAQGEYERTVIVKSLPKSYTVDAVRMAFSMLGPIEDVRFGKRSGASTRMAFVVFHQVADAENPIDKSPLHLSDCVLYLERSNRWAGGRVAATNPIDQPRLNERPTQHIQPLEESKAQGQDDHNGKPPLAPGQHTDEQDPKTVETPMAPHVQLKPLEISTGEPAPDTNIPTTGQESANPPKSRARQY